ncbi:hypothetical protein [Hafnia sp.]|uniref:hypothetical protein n=1 Tax=Hafnia sp. TaxID=1873498 RepID=UPI002FC9CC8C
MTDQNQLYLVKEVRVLNSIHDGVNQMNNLLTQGWILLSASSGVDVDGYPVHSWTVGRIKE